MKKINVFDFFHVLSNDLYSTTTKPITADTTTRQSTRLQIMMHPVGKSTPIIP